MLPLSFFRDRRFTVGSGVITVAFMAMFGFFFLASQYLQFVKGYSPLRAGAATLPAALMFILVAPRSARLADTYGFRRAVGFASFISAAGFGLMALLESDSTYWLFAGALVVMAIGQGMIAPPATTAIMSSVPLNQAGVGSAVNDTTRELGGAFGIAILGSIVTSAYRGSVELDGLSTADAEVARESVGGAWGVAQRIGGTQGQQLLDDAGRAFTSAFGTAMLVGAGILVLMGVVVAAVGHRYSYAVEPQPELEDAAVGTPVPLVSVGD
jgi:predicted MFS family arabinose efflux permease